MITDAALADLEGEVRRALVTGDRSGLDLRGFGVTSVVLAAPLGAPTVACKRVPPFTDRATFDRYREVVLRNIDEFRAAGLSVIDTDVRLTEAGGRHVGYVVQPLLATDCLAEQVLTAAEPSADHPVIRSVVDHVFTAAGDRRGLDAQVGNWAVVNGDVVYLDVTTPFLFDESGDLVMDLDVFLQAGPPVMRPLYRRVLPSNMRRWLDPRHALLDLIGNLYKLDLEAWIEPILVAIDDRVNLPLTVDEARDYYSGEVTTWSLLHRALKGYDWWQRRVRRTTPNGFLPPADYDPAAWKAKKGLVDVIGPGDFADRSGAEAAFGSHVDPGKVDVWSLGDLRVVMGERDGATFSDAYDGRRWFNCHCNGGVFNLGHRNPRVISAVRAAMDHADIGNHHLVSAYRAAAAAKLSATTDDRLSGVVFSVGGGEAVDLAIKVARGHTGRAGIVAVDGAYHGHTGLALAAGDPKDQALFGHDLPGFTHVPYNDLAAMDAAIGDDTAAVILESIPATAGFPMPDPGYLAAIAGMCRERGALYIADEVQTGLGRTGSVWYVDQEDVAPDLLVTGKGLSGGIYPIAATLMTPEIHGFFGAHPFAHVSTFGGAELGCVAAAEVLDIVTAPGFLERVRALGDRLGEAVAALPFDLRRRGLLSAFVFDDPHGGMTAMKALFDAGVYAFFAGNDPSVLQFKPVLTVSDDELDQIIAIVQQTFR